MVPWGIIGERSLAGECGILSPLSKTSDQTNNGRSEIHLPPKFSDIWQLCSRIGKAGSFRHFRGSLLQIKTRKNLKETDMILKA